MQEELIQSVKNSLYDRTTSPLCGAFLISWSLWNYRLLFVLFSSMEIDSKFSYIDHQLYNNNFWHDAGLLFGFPLLSSVAFLFLYPFPAKWVYGYWRTQQKKLKFIRQKIEDETPLTITETRKLKESFEKKITTLYSEIITKDHEINAYISRLEEAQKKNGVLQKALEEKEKLPTDDAASEQTKDKKTTNPVLDQLQAATLGQRYFNYSKNNGLIVVGADDQEFVIKFSKASNTSIHVSTDHPASIAIARAKGYDSGEIINFDTLDSSSRNYTVQLDEHFLMKNVHGYYMQARIKSIKDDTRGDAEDEVCFDYQINTQGNPIFRAL